MKKFHDHSNLEKKGFNWRFITVSESESMSVMEGDMAAEPTGRESEPTVMAWTFEISVTPLFQ